MNSAKNRVEEKSHEFALVIGKWYRGHIKKNEEFVLRKQLLRSATSAGANVSESKGGISDSDFSNKLSITYREVQDQNIGSSFSMILNISPKRILKYCIR